CLEWNRQRGNWSQQVEDIVRAALAEPAQKGQKPAEKRGALSEQIMKEAKWAGIIQRSHFHSLKDISEKVATLEADNARLKQQSKCANCDNYMVDEDPFLTHLQSLSEIEG